MLEAIGNFFDSAKENFKIAGSYLVIGVGVFMGIAVGSQFTNETDILGFLGLEGICVGIAGLGVMGVWSVKKSAAKRIQTLNEKMILKLAAQTGGVVTPAEVAVATSLSLTDSQKILENLQSGGFLDMKITPKGDILYQVRGLLNDRDRNNAEDVL
ncbi:MAG: hypothetical protein EAZ97_07460 [Bacteroidetes bacterium]|nr:MAG: hypothetical protein EAZ97_07460 [Bacteroidota bacterium]